MNAGWRLAPQHKTVFHLPFAPGQSYQVMWGNGLNSHVILLVALTIVFLGVTVTLLPFSLFSVEAAGAGTPITVTVLVALLVCLIPTTIAGLLSAIGVAGMSRKMQANVIATSGRAIEAAGDVDVLLLD